MDFDSAVNKLQRNHKRVVNQNRGRYRSSTSSMKSSSNNGMNNSNKPSLSSRSRKQVEELKRKNEELRIAKSIEEKKFKAVQSYFSKWENKLVLPKKVTLRPTSIHGNGDKITLPVSLLEPLMQIRDDYSNQSSMSSNNNSPFEFRIGILESKYKFPQSKSLQEMMQDTKISLLPKNNNDGSSQNFRSNEEDDDMSVDSDLSDDDENENDPRKLSDIYLEELNHKYTSFTYATVIEFTQEEGHIGLPSSIASKLLSTPTKSTAIPRTRTVDPASKSDTQINTDEAENSMLVENPEDDEDDEEKTPGHLAWGKFDIPDCLVEVQLVKLPKGKGCTLIPTKAAVQNGFHALKDVKAVLEQSLIRTKSTLSIGDIVHCWNRGKKFELIVNELTPKEFGAVSCINTDIEVEIGETSASDNNNDNKKNSIDKNTLEESKIKNHQQFDKKNNTSQPPSSSTKPNPLLQALSSHKIPVEPDTSSKNTCNTQIRFPSGISLKRRFDVSENSLLDLFAYTVQNSTLSEQSNKFRLVTRFPRRVFDIPVNNENGSSSTILKSLQDSGIGAGQEAFLVEIIENSS